MSSSSAWASRSKRVFRRLCADELGVPPLCEVHSPYQNLPPGRYQKAGEKCRNLKG